MFSISQMINVFIFFLSFNLTSVLNYANILTTDWILSSKSHFKFYLTKLTVRFFIVSLYILTYPTCTLVLPITLERGVGSIQR